MMSKNQDEYKSPVGVSDLYMAEVLEDSSSNYEADTPEKLAPVGEVTAKPKTDQTTQYADDQPFDVAVSEAETDLEMTFTNVPLETATKLTGKQWDTASGRMIDMPGVPPYFAVGFRSQKMNGKYRYFWYHKVMFSVPEEAMKGVAEKKEPQTVKLVAKAIKTVYKWTVNGVTDGIKRIVGDEDADNFSATGWYTQVQTPSTTTPSALALSSSVPVDDATNVSKTASITLTFNNKVKAGAINNVSLLDDQNALVTTTNTLDTTGKIMTLAHSALAGSKEHKVVIAVEDIYGQILRSVVTFTTAA